MFQRFWSARVRAKLFTGLMLVSLVAAVVAGAGDAKW